MRTFLSSILLTSAMWAANPTVDAPAAFRDLDHVTWKRGEPADTLARGEWWQLFGDRTLNDLESRALAANQDLRAAAARVEQARATSGIARSNYWPQIAAYSSVVR